MTDVLILKTAALGDVLRTTSILSGLERRYGGIDVTWVTAHGARPLVERHPLVSRVEGVDPGEAPAVERLTASLSYRTWDRVLSFDDEEPLCRLASALDAVELSGAYLAPDGSRAYTPDTAPWFDMGLISVHGKEAADRLKIENERSHPRIFADMLGIDMGRPELPLSRSSRELARDFVARTGLRDAGRIVGLNTGAGGRWRTKELDPARTIELARRLSAALDGRASFLVLGGPDERERNAEIVAGLGSAGIPVVDGGADNSLADFAALIDACDLLVTSDSMALHMAIARGVRIVAFFAPTSAAEIELYGLGAKVRSTAPDYCTYRRDADNSTLTPERLCAAALEVLERPSPEDAAEPRA